MKVLFSKHALVQMLERGAKRSEVVKAIRDGEEIPAKKGRRAFRHNLRFIGSWLGKRYRVKQIKPIVVRENNHYPAFCRSLSLSSRPIAGYCALLPSNQRNARWITPL